MFSIFFAVPSFSQRSDIDTLRLQRLNTDINLFIKEFGDFISSTHKTDDVSKINTLAAELNKSSLVLLDSINEVLGLNTSTEEINAGMYYGLSAAFSQSYPALSALYSSLSSTAVLDGNTAPPYYYLLKDIRDTSFKMSKKKKITKLKKMQSSMNELYAELKKME